MDNQIKRERPGVIGRCMDCFFNVQFQEDETELMAEYDDICGECQGIMGGQSEDNYFVPKPKHFKKRKKAGN